MPDSTLFVAEYGILTVLYRENVRVSVRSIDNLLIDYNLQKSDDDE